MNEKEKDKLRILKYISSTKESTISVAEIVEYSGAERMRVFPILYELHLDNVLAVSSHTYWGIPTYYFVQKITDKIRKR